MQNTTVINLARTTSLAQLAAGFSEDFSGVAAVAPNGKRRHLIAVEINFTAVATLLNQGVAQTYNDFEMASWFTVSHRSRYGQMVQNLNGLDILLLNFQQGIVRSLQTMAELVADSAGGRIVRSRLVLPWAPGHFVRNKGAGSALRGAAPLSCFGAAGNVEVVFSPQFLVAANNTFASPVCEINLIVAELPDELVYCPTEIRSLQSNANPVLLSGNYRKVEAGYARVEILTAAPTQVPRLNAMNGAAMITTRCSYDADEREVVKNQTLLDVYGLISSASPGFEDWSRYADFWELVVPDPTARAWRAIPVQPFANAEVTERDGQAGPVGSVHKLDNMAAGLNALAGEAPTYVTYSRLGRRAEDMAQQLQESGLNARDPVKYSASNKNSIVLASGQSLADCGLRPDQLCGLDLRWKDVAVEN